MNYKKPLETIKYLMVNSHLVSNGHLVTKILNVRNVICREAEHVESRERVDSRETEEVIHENSRGNQLHKVLEHVEV